MLLPTSAGVAGVFIFTCFILIASSFALDDDDTIAGNLPSEELPVSRALHAKRGPTAASRKSQKTEQKLETTTTPSLDDESSTATTDNGAPLSTTPSQTESDLLLGSFDTNLQELSSGNRKILKWSNGVVPFVIDSNITEEHNNQIQEGMNNLSSIACGLKFEQLNDQQNPSEQQFVQFIGADSTTCASSIGMQNNKSTFEQKVLFGNSCYTEPGIIMQILMHLVGFPHEHQRPDRDAHIKVELSNVIPDRRVQFIKINATSAPTEWLSTEYDLDSITHYDAYAHSFVPERLRTIIVLKNQTYDKAHFGEHDQLSEKDMQRLRKMYPCSLQSTQQPQRKRPTSRQTAPLRFL